MANKITESDIRARTFVTPTSRYMSSRVLYYSEMNRLTFTTYKRRPFVPDPDDMFMVVPQGWEFRPDLVSHKAYGFPDFWWKIMEANGLSDVYQFRAGLNIRVPNVNL